MKETYITSVDVMSFSDKKKSEMMIFLIQSIVSWRAINHQATCKKVCDFFTTVLNHDFRSGGVYVLSADPIILSLAHVVWEALRNKSDDRMFFVTSVLEDRGAVLGRVVLRKNLSFKMEEER